MCVAGKLYAVGGYDGASRQCLSTVEQYNPATNEWTYVADMSTRRSGAGTAMNTTTSAHRLGGKVGFGIAGLASETSSMPPLP